MPEEISLGIGIWGGKFIRSNNKDLNPREPPESPDPEIEEPGNNPAHQMIGDREQGELNEYKGDPNQGATHSQHLRRPVTHRGRNESGSTPGPYLQ